MPGWRGEQAETGPHHLTKITSCRHIHNRVNTSAKFSVIIVVIRRRAPLARSAPGSACATNSTNYDCTRTETAATATMWRHFQMLLLLLTMMMMMIRSQRWAMWRHHGLTCWPLQVCWVAFHLISQAQSSHASVGSRRQGLLFLYLVGAACAQWKIGESFLPPRYFSQGHEKGKKEHGGKGGKGSIGKGSKEKRVKNMGEWTNS